jgi:hypothetical protein
MLFRLIAGRDISSETASKFSLILLMPDLLALARY